MIKTNKLGIMQPYFFPYIGYWQLINAVDKFVLYDDVNYINRGWINRNKILIDGQAKYFNMFLSGASQNKLINQIRIINSLKEQKHYLNILYSAYHKAPYYKTTIELLLEIYNSGAETISEFNYNSIRKICNFLHINTDLLISSNIIKDTSLKGEEKILNICRIQEATMYINPIGGKFLYHNKLFRKEGIDLRFIKSNNERCVYKQFDNDFIHSLSIIDMLMFVDKNSICDMLDNYELQ